MNHNLGARLDTTIAKRNFIEVCYDAGMVAVTRNKAQIEGEFIRSTKHVIAYRLSGNCIVDWSLSSKK